MKDGDEWVTEAVFHARRGETKVGDAWVRVGEAEGKVRAKELGKAIGAELGPPVVAPPRPLPRARARRRSGGARRRREGGRRVLPADEARGRPTRSTACASRSSAWRSPRPTRATSSGSTRSSASPSAWSWPPGRPAPRACARSGGPTRSPWSGRYLFPNTIQVLESAVAHDVGYVLLNRYRFNFRFSSSWLFEGLAYWLEMQSIGRSATYTIGRGGIAGGGRHRGVAGQREVARRAEGPGAREPGHARRRGSPRTGSRTTRSRSPTSSSAGAWSTT